MCTAQLSKHSSYCAIAADGEYCCPITGKVFTEHTHIVAVKPTGNVYSWDAVEQLNIKPKSWKDLITDEPFTRKDIIEIQDPLNMTAKVITEFDHIKKVGGKGGEVRIGSGGLNLSLIFPLKIIFVERIGRSQRPSLRR